MKINFFIENKRLWRVVLCAIIFNVHLSFSISVQAQNVEVKDTQQVNVPARILNSLKKDMLTVKSDTQHVDSLASILNSLKKDRLEVKNVVVPEEHSATKALLLSLVPGLGQIYNGQAWKVPVIYGIFAAMGYFIYYNYDQMKIFKDEYLYRINHGDTPVLADYATYPTSSIYRLYNAYNRDYQLMVIITVGVYALNLIDAYVFGHLYEFHIDDNLSLSLSPGMMPTTSGLQPSLGVTLKF